MPTSRAVGDSPSRMPRISSSRTIGSPSTSRRSLVSPSTSRRALLPSPTSPPHRQKSPTGALSHLLSPPPHSGVSKSKWNDFISSANAAQAVFKKQVAHWHATDADAEASANAAATRSAKERAARAEWDAMQPSPLPPPSSLSQSPDDATEALAEKVEETAGGQSSITQLESSSLLASSLSCEQVDAMIKECLTLKKSSDAGVRERALIVYASINRLRTRKKSATHEVAATLLGKARSAIARRKEEKERPSTSSSNVMRKAPRLTAQASLPSTPTKWSLTPLDLDASPQLTPHLDAPPSCPPRGLASKGPSADSSAASTPCSTSQRGIFSPRRVRMRRPRGAAECGTFVKAASASTSPRRGERDFSPSSVAEPATPTGALPAYSAQVDTTKSAGHVTPRGSLAASPLSADPLRSRCSPAASPTDDGIIVLVEDARYARCFPLAPPTTGGVFVLVEGARSCGLGKSPTRVGFAFSTSPRKLPAATTVARSFTSASRPTTSSRARENSAWRMAWGPFKSFNANSTNLPPPEPKAFPPPRASSAPRARVKPVLSRKAKPWLY